MKDAESGSRDKPVVTVLWIVGTALPAWTVLFMIWSERFQLHQSPAHGLMENFLRTPFMTWWAGVTLFAAAVLIAPHPPWPLRVLERGFGWIGDRFKLDLYDPENRCVFVGASMSGVLIFTGGPAFTDLGAMDITWLAWLVIGVALGAKVHQFYFHGTARLVLSLSPKADDWKVASIRQVIFTVIWSGALTLFAANLYGSGHLYLSEQDVSRLFSPIHHPGYLAAGALLSALLAMLFVKTASERKKASEK